MNAENDAALAAFAVDLARRGGELARHWSGSRDAAYKVDESPVTEADHAVQKFMLEAIEAACPDYAVLAEEFLDDPRHARPSRYCWVIDPIDGTRNFARGIRTFATSVALLHAGRPIVAATYDACFGRVYSAQRGGGAFVDGRRMQVGDRPLDRHVIVAMSSFFGADAPPFVQHLLKSYQFRNVGSLCLHLAGVAAGDFDAVYALVAKVWDIAAGALLIEEAGGVLTSPDGGALWPIDPATYDGRDLPVLGAGRRLHAELVERFRE